MHSATARATPTKYANGYLYTLDLRSHAMKHLTIADQIERQKEHEMRALWCQTADTLRQGAAKGRKVLYIRDRADIDFHQWFEWKKPSGIYCLSWEKDNMRLETVGVNPFDASMAINASVLADEMVATSQGVCVRRVIYQDPVTGIICRYLTNLPAAGPGRQVMLKPPAVRHHRARHRAAYPAHREVHPLVEKPFGPPTRLEPSHRTPRRDLCPLVTQMLDTGDS